MEGSRHERAVIVIMSYVIGFTSAFIFYASVKPTTNDVFFSLPVPSNTAAVINAQTSEDTTQVVDTQTITPKAVSLSYTDGLLEVSVDEEDHLLSFNPEITGFDADFDSLSQGYHFGEIAYKASEDNRFVFFCERHDADDSTCVGYVYELSTNTIHQITEEGESVLISKTSAANASWAGGGLQIGESFSINSNLPWVLVSSDSPLDLE